MYILYIQCIIYIILSIYTVYIRMFMSKYEYVNNMYIYIHTYVTYVYVLVNAAKLHGVCWVCICKYLYNCAIRYDRSIYPPPGLL
jgi:hypothetical protein